MSISFEERKQYIIDILYKKDLVKIPELADVLGVSGETIRRDLDRMEKEHLLKKVHGGAVREKGTGLEPPFEQKSRVNAKGKRAICKAAADLVNDGDVIMIGHGTTSADMVHFLNEKRDVTIVTPSVSILMQSLEAFEGRVIFTGGELGREQKLTAGPLAEKIVGELKANKAFIAAGGISVESGITDYDLHGANLSRKMMERADDVILLADHSKFNKTTFAHIAALSEFSTIITDKKLPKQWTTTIGAYGIETIIA